MTHQPLFGINAYSLYRYITGSNNCQEYLHFIVEFIDDNQLTASIDYISYHSPWNPIPITYILSYHCAWMLLLQHPSPSSKNWAKDFLIAHQHKMIHHLPVYNNRQKHKENL